MKISQNILLISGLLLKNSEFIKAHRLFKHAFTRRRKLTFDRIASTLIHLVKQNLQIVCNSLGDYFHMNVPASKQAFSQGRLNLSHTCFEALNDLALQIFYSKDKQGLWKGYRAFAVDGSTIQIPESPDTLKYFGRWKSGEKNSPNCPVMGRVSECTDIVSGMIVSAILSPWKIGERELLMKQLPLLVPKLRDCGQEKLLFVYDRGYPSKDLFALHHTLGIDFVFRVSKSFHRQIAELLNETRTVDDIIELYKGRPKFRIAIYELTSGEKEVLLTSITDKELVTYDELFKLYGSRWRAMEEGYKRQKIQLELENFATKHSLGILQEFHASIYLNNIISISCYEEEGPSFPDRIMKYRLNRSVLFGSLREDILKTLTQEITVVEFDKKFKKIAGRCKIPIRPGRSFSREGLDKLRRHSPIPRVC